ncbi:unnamed protein product, partial [marine sediment metagenome]
GEGWIPPTAGTVPRAALAACRLSAVAGEDGLRTALRGGAPSAMLGEARRSRVPPICCENRHLRHDMADQREPRAVLLYSGGLDSSLACEVLRRAGVGVVALHHHSVFFPLREARAGAPACPTITRDITEEMIRLVAEPHYGLGKNANPCLDCKQHMYGLAWQEAQRQGADFIATGEVLGQRPMSQNRQAFARMEKGAGLRGLVVRPLSGRLLPPTVPEEQGLIDRADLLDLQGRSRKR